MLLFARKQIKSHLLPLCAIVVFFWFVLTVLFDDEDAFVCRCEDEGNFSGICLKVGGVCKNAPQLRIRGKEVSSLPGIRAPHLNKGTAYDGDFGFIKQSRGPSTHELLHTEYYSYDEARAAFKMVLMIHTILFIFYFSLKYISRHSFKKYKLLLRKIKGLRHVQGERKLVKIEALGEMLHSHFNNFATSRFKFHLSLDFVILVQWISLDMFIGDALKTRQVFEHFADVAGYVPNASLVDYMNIEKCFPSMVNCSYVVDLDKLNQGRKKAGTSFAHSNQGAVESGQVEYHVPCTIPSNELNETLYLIFYVIVSIYLLVSLTVWIRQVIPALIFKRYCCCGKYGKFQGLFNKACRTTAESHQFETIPFFQNWMIHRLKNIDVLGENEVFYFSRAINGGGQDFDAAEEKEETLFECTRV